MKKLMNYLLMSLFLIATGSGCESSTDNETKIVKESKKREQETTNEEKPEKLIVWEEEKKGDALKPILKGFEKEYGIRVEYKEVEVNDGMYTQLRRKGPIGKSPDIVTLSYEKVGQLVEEGLIQELKVDEEVVAPFLETAVSAETYQGKLFGLPRSAITSILVYNKKMMPKAPNTMNALYKKAKTLRQGNEYGFAADWNDFHEAYGTVIGMGGYVFKRDGKPVNPMDIGLNNEGARKGANYIQKWYKANIIPEGDKEDLERMFREGKVASIMSSNTELMDGKDIGITPMPKLSNGSPMKTILEMKGWHLTAFTQYPYWSTKLVEYLSNEKNALLRFEKTGELAPMKTISDQEAIKDSERAQAITIQLQYAEPVPNIPEMSKVWGPMDSAMQQITALEGKPEAALDEAVKKIKKSYDD
ncbi:sugar ABC transporter substrate-binding protein [Peribacillus sp. NPDC097675]|uniref:sugar ABC transporter substrate-binding protein n=1 Tax=Peribacillus sp. NPDC097675 TaxID=3390618 RepID=UPI003CFC12B5